MGIIEFPAIMPSGKPVWPQYWKLDELESVKASLSVGKWNAQWMQNPTARRRIFNQKRMVEDLGQRLYPTITTYHSKL